MDRISITVALLALAGCRNDGGVPLRSETADAPDGMGEPTCDPGPGMVCVCWDGRLGRQRCLSAYELGPCVCVGDDEPMGGSEMAVCGDGVVEGDEECDDGNAQLGDGCSDACRFEAGAVVFDQEVVGCLLDVAPDGQILTAGPFGRLVSLDADGAEIWARDYARAISQVVAHPDGGSVLYHPEDESGGPLAGGPRIVRSDDDGNELWSASAPSQSTLAVDTDGFVVGVDLDVGGGVSLLRYGLDGTLQTEVPIDVGVLRGPALHPDGRVVVMGPDGKSGSEVVFVEPSDGEIVQRVSVGFAGDFLVAHDGSLFVWARIGAPEVQRFYPSGQPRWATALEPNLVQAMAIAELLDSRLLVAYDHAVDAGENGAALVVLSPDGDIMDTWPGPGRVCALEVGPEGFAYMTYEFAETTRLTKLAF